MLEILYMMPAALSALVILGGLIFALTKIGSHRKPATWLAAALAALLLSHLAGWLGSIVISRMVAPNDFVLYHSILSAGLTLIRSAAIVLIICAVFASREEPILKEGPYADDNLRPEEHPPADSNPYS